MKSREDLLAAVARGEVFDYLLFWGHRPTPDGSVSKSCFSQWFAAPFEAQGQRFPTAEHFMMFRKAELFGDQDAQMAILRSADPSEAKALGRAVKGFTEHIWVEHRWNIVVDANLLKFSQNPKLLHFLLSTGETVLVEASPVDSIWGIGLAADRAEATDPSQWNGLNLLGFALMEVRSRLRGADRSAQ